MAIRALRSGTHTEQYAGTVDLVGQKQVTGHLVVADWKRSSRASTPSTPTRSLAYADAIEAITG